MAQAEILTSADAECIRKSRGDESSIVEGAGSGRVAEARVKATFRILKTTFLGLFHSS